jgi:hypothetical protein
MDGLRVGLYRDGPSAKVNATHAAGAVRALTNVFLDTQQSLYKCLTLIFQYVHVLYKFLPYMVLQCQCTIKLNPITICDQVCSDHCDLVNLPASRNMPTK